jgi:hypothetical protein
MDGQATGRFRTPQPPPVPAEGAWAGAAPPHSTRGAMRRLLAEEAARYLATVDAFRREGCRINWVAELA